MRSGQAFRQVFRFRNPSGIVRWVQSDALRDASGGFMGTVTDITERVEAEERLRRSEERYRYLFEASPLPMWIYDTSTLKFVDVNRAAEELLGRSRRELLELTIADVRPDADVPRLKQALQRLHPGLNYAGTWTYRRKDGTLLEAEITSHGFLYEGRSARLVLAKDVTDRARAERALTKSEERFRQTFDHAASGIAHSRPDGTIVLVNRRLCEILGYEESELLKLRFLDVTHPEDRELTIDYRRRMLAGESGRSTLEKRYVRKDGSVIWAQLTVSAVRASDGSLDYFVSVITDITAQKRAEEAVRESEARFRAAMEFAPIGMALVSLEGRWIKVNKALCAITGYSEPELLARSFQDITHPDDLETDLRHVEELVQGRVASYQMEKRYIRKDGSPVWVMLSVSLVRDARDKPLYFISQIEDISRRKEMERQLKESEERFRSLTELSSDWYWEQDEHYRFTVVSQAEAFDRDSCIGKTRWEHGYYAATEQEWAAHKAMLERRESFRDQVFKMHADDGSQRFVAISGRPIYDEDGRFKGYRGLVKDVTRQHAADEALRQSEARLRATLDAALDCVVSVDEEGRIIEFNPSAEHTFGYTRDEVLGRDMAELLIPPAYRETHLSGFARFRRTRRTEFLNRRLELPAMRRDGTEFPAELTIVSIESGSGLAFTAFLRDVSERRQAEERLLHLAHYDSLTGLPNRVLFHDRLVQTLVQAKRNQWICAVMFVDIDRFKLVNDTLGHALGDQLLRQVSQRLDGALRPGDTVGRLGGDEFGIILSDLAAAQDAQLVAQHLLQAFDKPFDVGGHETYVTASIGITLFPLDGDDPVLLVKNADAAMYRAKEEGRNTFQFFTPEMHARAVDRLSLESSLRRALDRGEFMLYYQPRVEIGSGRMVALEALLRWSRGKEGIVQPSEFVPILEETGLILPVGDWVLLEVCGQLQRWREQALPTVKVAVNLSPRQLQARGILDRMKRLMDQCTAGIDHMELEITESSLMRDPEQTARVLNEFRELGVRIAVDDFGTGYSSLAYLKRFTVDYVKIDRSFVRNVTSDPEDAAIVRAIITMAHELGLKVVAEGVETAQQLGFLATHGCDEAQGYLFSRPVDANAAAELLLQNGRGPLPK